MRVHVDRDSGTMQLEAQTHFDLAMMESLAELFGKPFQRNLLNRMTFSLSKELALCPNSLTIHLLSEGPNQQLPETPCKPTRRCRPKKGE